MNGFVATGNGALDAWVKDVASLCEPASIHLCDGSESERNAKIVRNDKLFQ